MDTKIEKRLIELRYERNHKSRLLKHRLDTESFNDITILAKEIEEIQAEIEKIYENHYS